jgi:hypothetical protein
VPAATGVLINIAVDRIAKLVSWTAGSSASGFVGHE